MTSTRLRTRRLRAATGLAVAGLAAALTLTGCSATNQMTTELEYDSSDGTSVRLGDIRALNFLIVSEGKGEPGTLIGALDSKGSDDEVVKIALEEDSVTVTVPAGQTVLLSAPGGNSDEDEDIVFESVPEPPGAFVPVVLTSRDAGSVTLQVPVLDGTLPEYAESVPSPES